MLPPMYLRVFMTETIRMELAECRKRFAQQLAICSTEERTRGIITNLSNALQQLQTEVNTAKDEQENVRKETSGVKQDVMKTEMDVKSKQKKLEGMISKLEAVKASEAAALVKLKTVMEKKVISRALDSQNSALIWVSNWEYEYLTKTGGEAANAVADKKIAAINGWMDGSTEGTREGDAAED